MIFADVTDACNTVGKIAKKLSKIQSYRLLFRRFCSLLESEMFLNLISHWRKFVANLR